jgi:hypothetical protein
VFRLPIHFDRRCRNPDSAKSAQIVAANPGTVSPASSRFAPKSSSLTPGMLELDVTSAVDSHPRAVCPFGLRAPAQGAGRAILRSTNESED